MSQNILDDFEESTLAWYDKLAQAIQKIPLLYHLIGILFSTYGSVAIMAYKSKKGIDIESLVFVPIGFLVLLMVLGGVVLYFFIFLSYLLKKITNKPNLVGNLDFASAMSIAGIGTFLTIAILAFLY